MLLSSDDLDRLETPEFISEVDILMDGGALMAGQCPSYYPAYKVSVWIKNHCSSNGRKRHVLSCLGPARDGMSQELYDYSP